MLTILKHIVISADELEFTAIRAQGSGGQNVNKVSSAIHLRFDIKASSLPDFYKERLLEFKDKRITADGIIVIKAQTFRTQQKNREDALERLKTLILDATTIQKTGAQQSLPAARNVNEWTAKPSEETPKQCAAK